MQCIVCVLYSIINFRLDTVIIEITILAQLTPTLCLGCSQIVSFATCMLWGALYS